MEGRCGLGASYCRRCQLPPQQQQSEQQDSGSATAERAAGPRLRAPAGGGRASLCTSAATEQSRGVLDSATFVHFKGGGGRDRVGTSASFLLGQVGVPMVLQWSANAGQIGYQSVLWDAHVHQIPKHWTPRHSLITTKAPFGVDLGTKTALVSHPLGFGYQAVSACGRHARGLARLRQQHDTFICVHYPFYELARGQPAPSTLCVSLLLIAKSRAAAPSGNTGGSTTCWLHL
jgi:hypothetical protein